MLHVQHLSGPDSDNDHYLVVAKDRERLSVNKRAAQKLHMELFNLKKLKDVKVKQQYQLKISNRFAALEDIYGSGEYKQVVEKY
jgi:hypothetical protein